MTEFENDSPLHEIKEESETPAVFTAETPVEAMDETPAEIRPETAVEAEAEISPGSTMETPDEAVAEIEASLVEAAPSTGAETLEVVDEESLEEKPAPIPQIPPSHMLEVRSLRKLYGKKVAVADVGFSMGTGEVTGLLGPNGAGKTTVFYMIVGFIKPTAGSVFLDGVDIRRFPMYKRACFGIAYLPQEPSVFRKLSVEKNVMAVLETRPDLNRRKRRDRLEELLLEFGIEGIRRQPAYTLSGGERRRTEIARALAIEPKFLLLDEPFAGIDPIAVHEIKTIIRRLSAAGIGVLITDHNVRDTLEITHRAHVINVGRIVVSGNREEVLQSEIARRIYLGEAFRM